MKNTQCKVRNYIRLFQIFFEKFHIKNQPYRRICYIWLIFKILYIDNFIPADQKSYPADSIRGLSSATLEPMVVSRSPTTPPFIPICRARSWVARLRRARPPAKRRMVRGCTKRNIAIASSTSSSLSGGVPSRGVPGIGHNRLMGDRKSVV